MQSSEKINENVEITRLERRVLAIYCCIALGLIYFMSSAMAASDTAALF